MSAEDTVRTFWARMNQADFECLRELMAIHCEVELPNTRELLRGRESYIRFQKAYPGRWLTRLTSLIRYDKGVVSFVDVQEEARGTRFIAVSVFELRDGLIERIREYWGECGEPPLWRIQAGLSERLPREE